MPSVPNSVLPEYPRSERAFPWLNADGRIAPVRAPQVSPPGMFDDLIPSNSAVHSPPPGIPPLPPGFVLDQSAKAPGMFDDLIPQTPPQQNLPPLPPGYTLDRPVQDTTAIPPLPPGFIIDTPPTQVNGLPPGFVIDQPAAPQAPSPDVTIGGNGEPTRITVRPTALQSFREAIDPANVMAAAGSALGKNARSLRVGAQGVASGVKDIVLAPVDLMAGLQNAIMSGVNKVTGTNFPMATPASKLVDEVTGPFAIPENQMSRDEKLGYNISRYATQGLGMGSMLMARAPAVAEAVMASPTGAGRILDNLARPYTAAPARTVTGDAIGGAGAGIGVNAANEYLPENPTTPSGQAVKAAANIVAPLAGGMGANAVQGVAEGIGGLIRTMATRAFTSAPREIPVNPVTKAPYSDADVDRAATQFQSAATGGPRALAQDIRENAAELRRPVNAGETPIDVSALPTSGLLSRDPGLVTLEGGARSKSSPSFVQRDQNVKEAAAQRIEGLRDPEADLGSVLRRAGQAREEMLAPADANLRQRAGDLAARDQARQQQGAEFGAVANTDAKANASRNLDRAVVDENYVPARAEKNRQFDEAPGRTEQLPADDVFAAIDRVLANNNALRPDQQIPGDLVQRLQALRPQMETQQSRVLDEFGNPVQREVNVGGPGTALGGDLADLRKHVSTAREQAQRSGNFDLADNLGTLGQSINRAIENAPGYRDANANYGQFAERFRPERNDEGAKFTREIDRGGQQPDGTLNRGSTPPSETAGRFLSSPEKSQALNRMLAGASSEQAGQAAIRDYMRSDFAMSALNPDGTLNPARAAAWSRNNADVLAQYPALRQEFDNIAAQARQGQQLSETARRELDTARKAAKSTEADIERSAVGTLLKDDPRDVAAGLLKGGYAAERKLNEINALVKNDEVAKRGWKAAVSEVLADKVQGSRMVGETPEVQFARLAKEFKDNEALLAKTFSPEEMNGLRQAHKILGYFKEAEKRATVGSNTADKWNVPGWAQLMIRHVKGDLVGGGIVKRFKLLLDLLPTNKQSADEIVHMAWFNPDVAAYLLERPIKNPNVPMYNVNLRRLIAADNAARQSGPGGE
jgi:hypothetical protein